MQFKYETTPARAITYSHKFAFLPTFIRSTEQWVWLKKYTATYRWSTRKRQYVLFWTELGHNSHTLIPFDRAAKYMKD